VFLQNEELRQYYPSNQAGSRGGFAEVIGFRNGGKLIFLTAESRLRTLAGFSAPKIYITELDGFRIDSRTTTVKYKEIEARRNAYIGEHDSWVYLESTPNQTGSNILNEYAGGTESQIVAPCVHCGNLIAPRFKDFILEACQFCCPVCGALISEQERSEMIGNLSIQSVKNSNTFSLFVPAFFNAFATCEFIADKLKETLKNPLLRGAILSTVFAEVEEDLRIDLNIKNAVGLNMNAYSAPRFVIPKAHVEHGFTACGVDCDKDRIFYVVTSTDAETINIIDFDTIKSKRGLYACFTILHKIMCNNFRTHDGRHIVLPYVLVDSRYSELEVHAACKDFGFLPIYGSKYLRKFDDKKIIYAGNTFTFNEKNRCNLREKNGITCLTIESNFYKSLLYSMLIRNRVFIYSDCTEYKYDYLLSHLTAEEPMKSGAWKIKEGHGANHYLDAAAYSLVLSFSALYDRFINVGKQVIMPADDVTVNVVESKDDITEERTGNASSVNLPKYRIHRLSTRPIRTRY
jgi:predicted RNA-binding Zn-ribbon protein involved in translation (DUF1610 family)